MMLERRSADKRRHPRQLTLRTAKIFHEGRAAAIDCAIVNISEGGACILLSNPAAVPDAFKLTIDRDGEIRGCSVAWRSGNRIGVAFTGGISFD
jgi:hypothetical protein